MEKEKSGNTILPLRMGESPSGSKETMMKKILAARGRIRSEFEGADFKSLFNFVCGQLYHCNSPDSISKEWLQVLHELKCLEDESVNQVPMIHGHNDPTPSNHRHVANSGQQNFTGSTNNQHQLVLGHTNGSNIFILNFDRCHFSFRKK